MCFGALGINGISPPPRHLSVCEWTPAATLCAQMRCCQTSSGDVLSDQRNHTHTSVTCLTYSVRIIRDLFLSAGKIAGVHITCSARGGIGHAESRPVMENVVPQAKHNSIRTGGAAIEESQTSFVLIGTPRRSTLI